MKQIVLYYIQDGDRAPVVAEGLKRNFDSIVENLTEISNAVELLKVVDISKIIVLTTSSNSDDIKTAVGDSAGWTAIKNAVLNKKSFVGQLISSNKTSIYHFEASLSTGGTEELNFKTIVENKLWSITVTKTSDTYTVKEKSEKDIVNEAAVVNEKVYVASNSGIITNQEEYESVCPEGYKSTNPWNTETWFKLPALGLNFVKSLDSTEITLSIKKNNQYVKLQDSLNTIGTITEDKHSIKLSNPISNNFVFIDLKKDLGLDNTTIEGLFEVDIITSKDVQRMYFNLAKIVESDATDLSLENANYDIFEREGVLYSSKEGDKPLKFTGRFTGTTTGNVTLKVANDAYELVTGCTIANLIVEGDLTIKLKGTGTITAIACAEGKLFAASTITSDNLKAISYTSDATEYTVTEVKVNNVDCSNGSKIFLSERSGEVTLKATAKEGYTISSVTIDSKAMTGEAPDFSYSLTGSETNLDIVVATSVVSA